MNDTIVIVGQFLLHGFKSYQSKTAAEPQSTHALKGSSINGFRQRPTSVKE